MKLIAFLVLLMGGIASAAAQENIYAFRVVDNLNNTYSLSGGTISGSTVFHCRLKDAVFTVAFDQVRSLAVDALAVSPYSGYTPGTFVLADGRSAQAYVDLNNYWIEGTEVNFNVRIKIKFSEVVSLELTANAAPPSPAPSPSPSPAPASAYTPPTSL